MATYAELNDPQDLSCSVNFHSTDVEAVKALAYFICKQLIHAHGIEKFATIHKNELITTEKLSAFLLSAFQATHDSEVLVDQLASLIHQYYDTNVNSSFSSFNGPNPSELMNELEKVIGKFSNNSSVACFTTTFDNFLMWSHYANGHNGVCIGYETEKEETDKCNITCVVGPNSEGKEIEFPLEIDRVKYSGSVPPIDFYEFCHAFINEGDTDLMNLSKSRWHPYADYIKKIFLHKLDPWSYEQEWRLANVEFKESMPEDKMFKYANNALKTVYFGVNSDVYSQLRIYNILGDSVTYYKCKLNGSNNLYSEEINMDMLLDSYLWG